MIHVIDHVTQQQLAFANHPFFRWLETATSRDEVARAFSQLTFWVASWKDVLAINEHKVESPTLREIVTAHRRREAGHDRWFFEDLHRLGLATQSAQDLFGRPTAPIRRAVYGLMSEAFRAPHDAARLALLVALESACGVFFDASADWVDRVAGACGLRYFSRRELAAPPELDIEAIELDDATRADCIAVVDRTYDAFYDMFDLLLAGVTQLGQRSLVHYVAQYA